MKCTGIPCSISDSLLCLALLALRSFPFHVDSSFLCYIEPFMSFKMFHCYNVHYIQLLWQNIIPLLILIVNNFWFCLYSLYSYQLGGLKPFYVFDTLFLSLFAQPLKSLFNYLVILSPSFMIQWQEHKLQGQDVFKFWLYISLAFTWSKLTCQPLFPYLVKQELLIIKVVKS